MFVRAIRTEISLLVQSGLGEKEISDSCDSNIPVVVENTDTSNNDIAKVEEIKMEPVENVV